MTQTTRRVIYFTIITALTVGAWRVSVWVGVLIGLFFTWFSWSMIRVYPWEREATKWSKRKWPKIEGPTK